MSLEHLNVSNWTVYVFTILLLSSQGVGAGRLKPIPEDGYCADNEEEHATQDSNNRIEQHIILAPDARYYGETWLTTSDWAGRMATYHNTREIIDGFLNPRLSLTYRQTRNMINTFARPRDANRSYSSRSVTQNSSYDAVESQSSYGAGESQSSIVSLSSSSFESSSFFSNSDDSSNSDDFTGVSLTPFPDSMSDLSGSASVANSLPSFYEREIRDERGFNNYRRRNSQSPEPALGVHFYNTTDYREYGFTDDEIPYHIDWHRPLHSIGHGSSVNFIRKRHVHTLKKRVERLNAKWFGIFLTEKCGPNIILPRDDQGPDTGGSGLENKLPGVPNHLWH